MSALVSRRVVRPRIVALVTLLVAADAVIYAGAKVGINEDGYAVPASADSDLVVIGPARGLCVGTSLHEGATADNTDGDDGDISVTVELPYERRIFPYVNDSGTAVTQADLWRKCWSLDDQTVSGSSSSGTRPVAGRVFEVTSTVIWVEHTADADVGDLATLDERVTTIEESVYGRQAVNATLVLGTVTINTGIVVAANSEVTVLMIGAITGSTNFASLGELKASRVAGVAGVGTVVIQAYGANGALDADAAGPIRVLIDTPL